MKDLKKIMSGIEDAFAAASFAEEGDFEAAREILHGERRVLLAVRGNRIDTGTLRYAINTCKRIKADLDILHISSSEVADSLWERFLSGLKEEGILYRMIKKSGCLKQAIIDYTREKKGILFVVIESSDSLDVNCGVKDKRLSEAWKNLACPLVVVSEAAKA